MLEQKGLIFLRGKHLTRNQVALVGPAPGQVGLQETQSLRCIVGVDRTQDMFVLDAQ